MGTLTLWIPCCNTLQLTQFGWRPALHNPRCDSIAPIASALSPSAECGSVLVAHVAEHSLRLTREFVAVHSLRVAVHIRWVCRAHYHTREWQCTRRACVAVHSSRVFDVLGLAHNPNCLRCTVVQWANPSWVCCIVSQAQKSKCACCTILQRRIPVEKQSGATHYCTPCLHLSLSFLRSLPASWKQAEFIKWKHTHLKWGGIVFSSTKDIQSFKFQIIAYVGL